jgi:hypothetical protein
MSHCTSASVIENINENKTSNNTLYACRFCPDFECRTMKSFCPTHRCRTMGCSRRVNEQLNGLNYYCMEHMACGLTYTDKPCSGCLNTYQKNNHDKPHESDEPDESDKPHHGPVPVVSGASGPVPVVSGASGPVPVVSGASGPVPVVSGASGPVPIVSGASGPVPVVSGASGPGQAASEHQEPIAS